MSNWIDAHAHLSDPRWVDTITQEIDKARDAGIARFVLGGVDPADWERQRALARTHPGVVYPAFGLHPWFVAAHPAQVDEGLARLRAELGKPDRVCVAIGETGLDHHPRFGEGTYPVQARSFRAHLELALEFGLPVVLHIVRAHPPALEILRDASRLAGRSFRGIVHSFSGDLAQARAYLALGLIPSISAAVITRGSGTAFEKLKAAVVTLGATDFVIETDAPDQPPAGEAGPNRLTNLVRIAEVVAGFRGTTAIEVLDQSTRNVLGIFSPP